MNTATKEPIEVINNEKFEIKELIKQIPILHDKMVVDLINGLEVTQEHIRFRDERDSFLDRAWDTLTDTGFRRQQIIDRNISEGLKVATIWLQNLQEGQITTDRAVIYIARKLHETRQGICRLNNSHLEIKQDVELLFLKLDKFKEDIDKGLTILNQEIQKVSLRQSAKIHLDKVFDAWESGKFKQFPPIVQLFLTLEELFWSSFGRYDMENHEFRSQLRDLCIIQLKRISNKDPVELFDSLEWFIPLQDEKPIHREMLSYLLLAEAPYSHSLPLTSTMSRILISEMKIKDRRDFSAHKDLPFVLNQTRLIERLINETGVRLNYEG